MAKFITNSIFEDEPLPFAAEGLAQGKLEDGLSTQYNQWKQKDTPQTIRGGSHLVFSEDGLVTLHRDYWDAAEELYEKLPVVGSLMRWLKKRANS